MSEKGDVKGKSVNPVATEEHWAGSRQQTVISLLLFLLALGPRLAGLGLFMTTDEPVWIKRSAIFASALLEGHWSDTFVTGHPGVTTMWAGTLGLAIRYLLDGGGSLADFLTWAAEVDPLPIGLLVAVRLPVALLIAVGVVAVYQLSRELFGGGVGLAAAILLAFDPFYLAHSRLIHHDALVATFMIVSVLSLLAHFGGRRAAFYLVLSGLCAGLAFLTKSSAVFLLPFWGVAALLHGRREAVREVAIWGLVAALVMLALWPVLWFDPFRVVKAVWDIASAATFAPHAKGTFLFGQARADPGPLFYPVSFLFRSTPPVLLGLAALAFTWAGNQAGERRRAVLTLLLYAAGFALLVTAGHKKGDRYLLPVFLAADVMAAFGLWNLFKAQRSRLRFVLPVCLVLQAAFALPHFPYYITYYDPLVGGGRLAPWALSVGWGEGLEEAARHLSTRPEAEKLEVAAWYSRQFRPFFRGQTVDMSDAEPTLRADYAVFYVNQVQRGLPLAGLVDYFRRREVEHVVRMKGIDYAWIYRGPVVGFEPPAQIAHPVSGIFGGRAQLLGYDLRPASVESGGECHVTLYWQALAETEESYNVYLRLADEEGHPWGQVDRLPVMGYWTTDRWQPGTFIVDEYDLEVLPGTPPGEYILRLGLYSFETGHTLEAVNEAGRGPDLALGRVSVVRPEVFPRVDDLAMRHALEQKVGDEIVLLGHDFEGGTVQPGALVPLTLYWRAVRQVEGDYLVQLALRDEEGQIEARQETRPARGRYPTPGWEKSEIVRDQEELLVRASVAEGEYQVTVGLVKGDELLGETTLGRLKVEGRARTFEVPPLAQPLRAGWEHLVELLGYDLNDGLCKGTEGTLCLTLYWQALAEMDTSYTVFIHLLDEGGRIWGQRDSIPGDGTLPTTSWLRGEIIADEYEVALAPDAPPGQYTIEIGWYEAATGKRLTVFDEEGRSLGDRLLLDRKLEK